MPEGLSCSGGGHAKITDNLLRWDRVFKVFGDSSMSILLLSSCSLGGSRTAMLNNSNDDEKAKDRLEAVIKALEN